MSPAAALRALKRAGLKPHTYAGWDTHTRSSDVRPWGPVHGVMIHHTASHPQAKNSEVLGLLVEGTEELPGPLCHIGITPQAEVHMIGWGRTNHAGAGDPAVFAAVVGEQYGYYPPPPTRDATDGNTHLYGIELVHSGHPAQPWPKAQVEAAVKVAAALCRAHKWNAKSVIGHKEWTERKPDPANLSMLNFRTHVQELLDRS